MKTVFLAHPVRGDVAGNLANVTGWYRWACTTMDVAATVPWYLGCIAFDDANDKERIEGIRRNLVLLLGCDELWLCGGRISAGMLQEASHAAAHGIPVWDLTDHGYEAPTSKCVRFAAWRLP